MKFQTETPFEQGPFDRQNNYNVIVQAEVIICFSINWGLK